MKYICLIYGDEAGGPQSAEEGEALHKAYWAYTQDLQSAGKMVAGEALESVATATTVRVRGGETLTTDGPFAETKEQLGGFYLVDCDNLDEALQWAAKIPGASTGSVEVRPIMNVM
jgi:hypothetical protein